MMRDRPEVTFGKITEEGLARMRDAFGRPHYPQIQNAVASQDAIRQFAWGIGDDNPLWHDLEYASKSRYGHIVAPPFFLYAVAAPQGMEGLPGVHAFHCGCAWEWYETIHVDDKLTCVDIPTDLVEKHGKMGGRQFLQLGQTIYRNQRGNIVAINKRETMRIERQAAKDRGKYTNITKHRYAEEELRKIDEMYQKEEVRGANFRYWEDVKLSDDLTPVVKGPLALTDMVEFMVGIGGGQGAHRIRWKYMKKHPMWGVRDPETGTLEPMADVHYESAISDAIGVPMAYDLGMQRFSWAGHLITNWMGDDGFLERFDSKVQAIDPSGDARWCRGKVIKRYVERGKPLVDLAVWIESIRGWITTSATATVALPSRRTEGANY